MLRFVKGRIAGRTGLTALAVGGFVSPAFATGGTLSPVQSTLQTLVTTLTGPIATSLAILAVIALGFFAWSGRLTWVSPPRSYSESSWCSAQRKL